MSDPERRAAAGAAGEPPSGGGGVFVQHSILGPGMAALGNGQQWHSRGPGAGGGVEEGRLAASQDARLEGRTCSPPLHETVGGRMPGSDAGRQRCDCPGPGFLLGFPVAPRFLYGHFLMDCRQRCWGVH